MSVDRQRCGMGLFFYPGAAPRRSLATCRARCTAGVGTSTLASGSLGPSGALGDAATVFAGLAWRCRPLGDAVASWRRATDAMAAPTHPAVLRGAPGRARAGFPAGSRPCRRAQGRRLGADVAGRAEHSRGRSCCTSPPDAAPRRCCPSLARDRSLVTHLHGTELKMLDGDRPRLSALAGGAARHARRASRAWEGAAAQPGASGGRRASRRWTARGEGRAPAGADPATVNCIANGRRGAPPTRRPARCVPPTAARTSRRASPPARGCREPRRLGRGEGPGSMRYAEREVVDAFVDRASRRAVAGAAVRRPLPRLQARAAAHPRLRSRAAALSVPAPLVDLGRLLENGRASTRTPSPTEGSGRRVLHRLARSRRAARSGLACADCFVAPSTDEPFGLVYLEAMSAACRSSATRSGGPPSFVNVVAGEPDGWLVEPRRRGRAGRRDRGGRE